MVRPIRHVALALIALACGISTGCRSAATSAPSSPPVAEILSENSERFGSVTARASELRVQVLLSEVVRGRSGPELRRSAYRSDAEYFYPASAIKLCAAVAAVQTLEDLNRRAGSGGNNGEAVTLDTPLRYEPLFAGESVRDQDPSNLAGGAITLRHEIRKLFLVSDNDAFNRLYEFVGHRELNETMHRSGLASVVINHRLSVGRSADENRRTPRIVMAASGAGGEVVIPQRDSTLMLANRTRAGGQGLHVGKAYMAAGKQLKLEPMDFAARNGISIVDLQDLLVMLVRPDIRLADRAGIALAPEHREFLLQTMAEYPGDSANPKYDRRDFPDDWGKFFLPGLVRVGGRSREDLTIYNKVGQAYGFTIDNAYIADKRTGRAFFLTAVIYTNADEVLNDDTYEYESVAFPFMANLAEAVAREVWNEGSVSRGRAE